MGEFEVATDGGFWVAAGGSETFLNGASQYFKDHKVPDNILNHAIVDLSCRYNDDGDLKFIDYKRLSPDHLGSLFEGLLEYKLKVASDKLVDTGDAVIPWSELEQEEKFKLKDFTIEKGELYLESGTGERKDTGSFYTPSYVVDYMVKCALEPLCKGKSLKEILKLKIVDPAMGSGHFLLGAIKYLEDAALKAVSDSGEDITVDQEKLRFEILHNCIYGVDLNPLAVELSKFSLWIYSVQRDCELEPLDDQLKHNDSLLAHQEISKGVSVWKKMFPDVIKNDGFDAIVGNPPYVARKNSNYVGQIGDIEGQGDLYLAFIDKSLSTKGIPLKSGGYLAQIVPDPLLIRGNARKTRKEILANHKLINCVHINGVFNAGVSNVILLIQKNGVNKDNVARFTRIDSKELRETFKTTGSLPPMAFSCEIEQAAFSSEEDAAWSYLLSSSDISMLSLMRSSGKTLTEYYEDRRGEETSKSSIKNNLSRSGRPMLIGGEGIKPFEIERDSVVIVKSSFIKKKDEFYRAPKVILQKSSPKFVCAVDDGTIDSNGLVVPQSVYILQAKDKNAALDCWFIAALLNSKLGNDYLFKGITGYKLLQPHFEQKDIKNFPMFDVEGLDTKKIAEEKKNILAHLKKTDGKVPKVGLSRESLVGSVSAISMYLHEISGMDADKSVREALTSEVDRLLLAVYKSSASKRKVA